MNAWLNGSDERRHCMLETIRSEARQCARYTGRPDLSERVMEVMAELPRHSFVPLSMRHAAYDNAALPVGHGQTISQPFIVALMTDLLDLQGGERVLEIGTGTGYQTAILAHVVSGVYSVECIPSLSLAARSHLDGLSLMDRVQLLVGNGWQGWGEKAPFDAIIVTAAAKRIPQPLIKQLAPGGRLVIPVGPAGCAQQLLRVEKSPQGKLDICNILPVVFVPLVENP